MKSAWKKNIIYKTRGMERYEYKKGGHTIDVTIGKTQGYPGSNMVNVFAPKYGGWVLNTPKMLSTRTQVNRFVRQAKFKLDKGILGRKVAFPREDYED
jgi:hypothetical protein